MSSDATAECLLRHASSGPASSPPPPPSHPFCLLSFKQVLPNVKPSSAKPRVWTLSHHISHAGAAQTCTLNRCFAFSCLPPTPPFPNFPGDFSEDTAEWMNGYPSSMFVPRRRGQRKTKHRRLFLLLLSFFSLKDLLMRGLSQP